MHEAAGAFNSIISLDHNMANDITAVSRIGVKVENTLGELLWERGAVTMGKLG